jgi:hypothetical protein
MHIMRRRSVLMLCLAFFIGAACAAADDDDTVPGIASLKVGGAVIDVGLKPGQLAVSQAELVHWIDTAAHSVSHYYGRFPVPHVSVPVLPRPRSGRASGTTYGEHNDALIRITLGSTATAADLKDDWVMTHEMTHLAFPQVAEEHHWIEEGLATYVEPIARAQVGELTPEYVWQETVEGMPKGLPAPDDQGLDHTHTWGRTYWGGALFCLLADVEIRERTHNRYGLQDALRGILAAGGNIEQDWPITRSFAVADKTVGVTVLEDLYAEMKDKPVPVDLDALWKKLGVVYKDGQVTFDEKAPEADIRRSITASDSK